MSDPVVDDGVCVMELRSYIAREPWSVFNYERHYQVLPIMATLTLSEGAEPFAQDAEMLNKLAVAVLPAATVECSRLRYLEE